MEQFEMPTPCICCNNVFDLNDGCTSEKWFPNTIICEDCANEEEKVIELEDELEQLKIDFENAKWDVEHYGKRIRQVEAKLNTEPSTQSAAPAFVEVEELYRNKIAEALHQIHERKEGNAIQILNHLLATPSTLQKPQSAAEERFTEAEWLDKLIKELPQEGIDTSKWEYKYGDNCYTEMEFIARAIKGFGEKDEDESAATKQQSIEETIHVPDIQDWVDKIINGSGGFKEWEEREWVIFHTGREVGIANFVLRCLANPHNEGAAEVLHAIMLQRLGQLASQPVSDWKHDNEELKEKIAALQDVNEGLTTALFQGIQPKNK